MNRAGALDINLEGVPIIGITLQMTAKKKKRSKSNAFKIIRADDSDSPGTILITEPPSEKRRKGARDLNAGVTASETREYNTPVGGSPRPRHSN